VLAMANIFICGMDGKSAFPNLHRIWGEGAGSPWISWRAVVSDREADECAAKYVELLDFLAAGTRSWKVESPLAVGEPPSSTYPSNSALAHGFNSVRMPISADVMTRLF